MMMNLLSPCLMAAALLSNILPASALPKTSGSISTRQNQSKYVTAHFMVGIVGEYTVADWVEDMEIAKETGIDAFALNCAKDDPATSPQLANAYEAAEQADFKVFISFDFAYYSNDDTEEITNYVRNYSSHPGQLQYNDAALVSTFVGGSFDWGPVKDAVDDEIFAVPNHQDPSSLGTVDTSIDGAFSWYAWPTSGDNSIIPGPITTAWDDQYIDNLGDKAYMAPVSPWFFTHFDDKNWAFICEDQITVRWQQMLDMQPELIEIITWNDYGESHYIGPYSDHHSDDGSSQWAKGFPHDGWRIISKPYIEAYKAGESSPTVESDQLVYWYRPTPKDVTCSNDPLGPPDGVEMLSDSIFVTTLLTEPATLTVTSGSNDEASVEVDAGIVTSNFTMGVGSQSFSVTRGGNEIMGGEGGLDITDECEFYNFNVYVGSFGANGGD